MTPTTDTTAMAPIRILVAEAQAPLRDSHQSLIHI